MIEAYRKVLQLEPGYAEAYAQIGEALYDLNRTDESKAALTRAISLNAQDAGSRKLLGKIYQEAGAQDQALALFEEADQVRPGDRDVIYRLFRIYRSKGDKQNATRMQERLETQVANNISQAKSESEAVRLNEAGIDFEKRGKLPEALQAYDEATKADVANPIFPRNAALLLCKMGRAQEAIPRLREILLLDPDDAVTVRILQVAEEMVHNNAPLQKSSTAAQGPR